MCLAFVGQQRWVWSLLYLFYEEERMIELNNAVEVLMDIQVQNMELRKLLKSARAELWYAYNSGSSRPLLTIIDKIDTALEDVDVE